MIPCERERRKGVPIFLRFIISSAPTDCSHPFDEVVTCAAVTTINDESIFDLGNFRGHHTILMSSVDSKKPGPSERDRTRIEVHRNMRIVEAGQKVADDKLIVERAPCAYRLSASAGHCRSECPIKAWIPGMPVIDSIDITRPHEMF